MLIPGCFPLNHAAIRAACQAGADDMGLDADDRDYWAHQVRTLDQIQLAISSPFAEFSAEALYDLPEDYWTHRHDFASACLQFGDCTLGLALRGVPEPKFAFVGFGVPPQARDIAPELLAQCIKDLAAHIPSYYSVSARTRAQWQAMVERSVVKSNSDQSRITIQIPFSLRELDNDVLHELAETKIKAEKWVGYLPEESGGLSIGLPVAFSGVRTTSEFVADFQAAQQEQTTKTPLTEAPVDADLLYQHIQAQCLSGNFEHPADAAFFKSGKLSGDNPDHLSVMVRLQIERTIVRRIFTEARSQGLLCRVHDGEDWAGSASAEVETLMGQIQSTDEDQISLRKMRADGTTKAVGTICLVYGNDGPDVIADNSANTETESVLVPAENLAEQLEIAQMRECAAKARRPAPSM